MNRQELEEFNGECVDYNLNAFEAMICTDVEPLDKVSEQYNFDFVNDSPATQPVIDESELG